ncbi:MAG: DNRLRE domain-containing protein, partial [bacterium]
MRTIASGQYGRLFTRALMSVLATAGAASVASAQTTVTLNQPTSQVLAATVRGGSYANQNNEWTLATRASDDLVNERRALLKFDTENTIPKGSVVTSALLTVTLKSGSADASRTIGAYQTSLSWTEDEVTWNSRRKGQSWSTPGGDYGSKLDEAVVSNKAGTKVIFDVTPLVKSAVAGALGSSRYTRIALIDMDGSTADSYHVYFSPNDSNTASRPV